MSMSLDDAYQEQLAENERLRERVAELEAENEKLTKRCDMFAGTILEYQELANRLEAQARDVGGHP